MTRRQVYQIFWFFFTIIDFPRIPSIIITEWFPLKRFLKKTCFYVWRDRLSFTPDRQYSPCIHYNALLLYLHIYAVSDTSTFTDYILAGIRRRPICPIRQFMCVYEGVVSNTINLINSYSTQTDWRYVYRHWRYIRIIYYVLVPQTAHNTVNEKKNTYE
jgi:hypothetical protein